MIDWLWWRIVMLFLKIVIFKKKIISSDSKSYFTTFFFHIIAAFFAAHVLNFNLSNSKNSIYSNDIEKRFFIFFTFANWRLYMLKCHSYYIHNQLNYFLYFYKICRTSFSMRFSTIERIQNKCHFFILNICRLLAVIWSFRNFRQLQWWRHFSFIIQIFFWNHRTITVFHI